MKRILWFSNSPVSLDRTKKLGYVGGGWISSLEKEVSAKPEIELGIVIQQNRSTMEEVLIDNVKYFICPVRTGRVKRKIGLGKVFKIDDEQAVTDYLNIIDSFKPDIIHIFGTENNYGLIVPKVNIPVVIHIQGILTLIDNKFYTGISAKDIARHTKIIDYLKGAGINQYYKNSITAVEREQKIFSNCRYLIGRTGWDKRASSLLAPKATYFHCDEMIRNEFFSYTWENPKQDVIRILSILRSNPYKGFDLVFRTSCLLKEKNFNFEWIIAGVSEKDRVLQLFLGKYKHRMVGNIHFIGNKNSAEIIELMKISNVFVHTSYIENSPNSICEAMLVGMPVISNFVGGTPSLLESEKEGILIQEGDPYSMASAIMELASNPIFAIKLGHKARKRALVRHNPDNIVNTLFGIYKTIIEDYRKTVPEELKTRKKTDKVIA